MKSAIRILALLMLCSIISLNAFRHQLALCAIFKNEGRFLKEWLEFNMLVGVEHFYLYNNNSTDNYEEILKPYIDAGIVDCIDWDYPPQDLVMFQALAYNDCLNKARGNVKWIMFIDTDEFLFPVQCGDLRNFLKDYEDYGAVCANWVMFGTSHVKEIPADKLLVELLVMSASLDNGRNKTVKSIVQPEKVEKMGVHRPTKFFPGYFQVTANKERFEGNKTELCSIDKVRINHYWVRDEEFLHTVKLPRLIDRNADKWERKKESDSFLKKFEALNRERDTIIYKYIRRLRERVFGASRNY